MNQQIQFDVFHEVSSFLATLEQQKPLTERPYSDLLSINGKYWPFFVLRRDIVAEFPIPGSITIDDCRAKAGRGRTSRARTSPPVKPQLDDIDGRSSAEIDSDDTRTLGEGM